VESALRSRFGEKTLVPLPPLPSSAEYEVMLLIDMRERCNARIQSSMAAYGIPCRLSTLAVGDFLWAVRPRQTGVSAGSSSSSSSGVGAAGRGVGAPIAQRGAVVSSKDDGMDDREDTRASNTADCEPEEDAGDESFDPQAVYVLDCIAERKSINDLVSSFGDGRYTEQKNRLKACNLRSTMYIVEGEHIVVSMHQKAISAAHVKTAMVSIHVSYSGVEL
jgi:ERCC4-type nuclease